MPSNSTTRAESTPSKRSLRGDVDTGILPNILDAYENPTYHFRLYMMGPGAVATRNFGNQANNQRVVIAESGVTPIDIDNVEIKTRGSITKDAGVGVATNFSFTLREPFGVTLLDQIQRAGYFLDIENFQKFPMFLELSFKGRRALDDNAGNNAESDNPLRGQVWTWPIQLTDMAMNVTTGGSVYSFEAVGYSDHAYSNQASDIEKSVNIVTDTVGDFFTQLQEQLNQREVEKEQTSGYKGKTSDKYQFYVDDLIYNEKIVPTTTDELQNRAATYNAEDGKLTFSFQPGISIEKIVYNVLSLTKFYQKESKGTEDPDSPSEAGGNEDAIYQQLWRIIADTDVGAYDNVRSDYQRYYKYLIIPYEMTSGITPSNITAGASDIDRLNSHRRRGLIRKVYDYIYTGLNDQVFDFELNFNFNWFAALPIQGGLTTIASRQEVKGKATPEQREDTDRWAKKVDDFNQFAAGDIGFTPLSQLEDFLNGSINSLTSSFDPATNAINSATLQVSDVIGNANAAAQSALATTQNGIAEFPSPIAGIVQPTLNPVITGTGSLLDRLTAGTRIPRVSTGANGNTVDSAQKNIRSLDIQLDAPDVVRAANQRIQTSIQETKTQESDGQTYAAAPGQTLLSAMFEQAQSPVSKDLINIELRVKGDPYWLEPAPTRLGQAPTSMFRRLMANRGVNPDPPISTDSAVPTNTVEQDEITVANTAEQQTLIVFRSFTPQDFDPVTGLTPAGKKNSNVLNGIYAVKEVVHSFSGGEFTQTLYGIRNVFINLRNVDLFENLRDIPEDTVASNVGPRRDTESASDAAGGVLNSTGIPTFGTDAATTAAAFINPIGDGGNIFDTDEDQIGPTVSAARRLNNTGNDE